eukprot:3931611-Rhodomonas_salina.2
MSVIGSVSILDGRKMDASSMCCSAASSSRSAACILAMRLRSARMVALFLPKERAAKGWCRSPALQHGHAICGRSLKSTVCGCAKSGAHSAIESMEMQHWSSGAALENCTASVRWSLLLLAFETHCMTIGSSSHSRAEC